MADFYATARSNYIKVKDIEKAKTSLAPFGNTIHIHPTHPEYFMVEGHDGGIQNNTIVDGEEKTIDWRQWAMEHLVPGQTLIMVYAGAEKLRYVSAGAEAYTWNGKVVNVDLMQTLDQRLRRIGLQRDQIAMPQYTEISTWEPGQQGA